MENRNTDSEKRTGSEKKCYSGIGGQAVLEGVMMKNAEKYAVAVRKEDGSIVVQVHDYVNRWDKYPICKLPFIRGCFNFVDSMMLGTKVLNESAEYFEEEDSTDSDKSDNNKDINKDINEDTNNKNKDKENKDKENKDKENKDKEKKEDLAGSLVTVVALVFAVFLFMVLPVWISAFLNKFLHMDSLLALIEGVIRILIFIGYILAISLMKDIKRLFMYHGAEHKCINCIEHGMPLTVENVKKSSRLHKRCGTSFIFFVFLVSLVLFFFIKITHPLLRVCIKLLLLPVVAGISYELIRLAGKSENILVKILSAPGMGVQLLTTKEPDEDMIKVAMASVEAVFDWKQFLHEKFGK